MKVTNYKVQKVGNAMNMDFGPVLDLLVKVRDNCACTNLISKYVGT